MAHVPPTPADFKAKFPALASLPDATIQLALSEAAGRVDETWPEADFAPGRLYLAAHILTRDGHGPQAQAAALQAQGVKSFKSGTLSAEFRDGPTDSPYATTSYGVSYLELLNRVAGGPLVARVGGGGPSHLAQDHPPHMGWQ